jgi:hypothetical protein
MSSTNQQVGPEGRYLARFSKIRQQTGDSIKNIDSAGNVTQHLTHARASLKTQEANTRALFSTAQEMIAGIDTTQQMLGHTFVKNMPSPTKEIIDNPGRQLGYVQLAMRFMQAGVVHFMEEMNEATDRIEHLERVLGKLADYDEEVNLLGELQTLDLESLESKSIQVTSDSITAPITKVDSLPTPPISPMSDKDKSKQGKSSSTSSKKK